MALRNLVAAVVLSFPALATARAETIESPGVDIFPPVAEHVHAPTIVELSNGDLLAAWFQGDGERSAERVAIVGARLNQGETRWSAPFLMADTSGLPDINPVLFLDPKGRLWLVWYTVIAHQWETSLLKYRISSDFERSGPPRWDWQEVLHVKPGGNSERGIQPDDRFVRSVETQLAAYGDYLKTDLGADPSQLALFQEWSRRVLAQARGEDMLRRGMLVETGREQMMGFPYFRRMGWQTRNKPLVLESGRIILPLYSDGFDFSLMAITDDLGETWSFSEPLVGTGNIQAAVLEARDGSLVAYMRDNGPAPKRLHLSRSEDGGLTWSGVRNSVLPNPGSGADAVTLRNGGWVIVYNDTESGRHSLAVSLSNDDGESWAATRHLEFDDGDPERAARSHYPAIIEGRNGDLHIVYSHHRQDSADRARKTIRYARISQTWITQPSGR